MDAISVDRRVNEWRLQSWDLVCGGCASGECHEPAPDLSWGQSAAARLLPLQLQPSGTSQQWQYLLLCGVRIINIYINYSEAPPILSWSFFKIQSTFGLKLTLRKVGTLSCWKQICMSCIFFENKEWSLSTNKYKYIINNKIIITTWTDICQAQWRA